MESREVEQKGKRVDENRQERMERDMVREGLREGGYREVGRRGRAKFIMVPFLSERAQELKAM